MQIVAAVVAGACAVAMGWWWYSRRVPRTKRGMKQFAQQMVKSENAFDPFKLQTELLARASFMSDAELAQGLDGLLSSDPEQRRVWNLVFKRVGKRTEPILQRAFKDPRCDSAKASDYVGPRTPFELVTELLSEIGSPSVIEPLEEWYRSEERRKRSHAIRCIASTGRPEAIRWTIDAMVAKSEGCLDDACYGILSSCGGMHVTPEFRSQVFAVLAEIITNDAPSPQRGVSRMCDALISLDKDAGSAVLCSEAVLRVGHSRLSESINALNEAEVHIPEHLIAPILKYAKSQDKYPWTYVRAFAVRALARVSPTTAMPEIEEAFDADESRVRSEAAEALREIAGLPRIEELWGDEAEFCDLIPEVQHVLAAIQFQGEVNNGGISQYFFNPSGDDWPTALEAFEVMGANETAKILRAAAKHLGRNATSLDRNTRINAYARLSDNREDRLEDLNRKFYKDPDRLDVCIVRYMARHAAVFRAASVKQMSSASARGSS